MRPPMAQRKNHMPTFKTKATSAARAKLAETIAARAEVDSRIAETPLPPVASSTSTIAAVTLVAAAIAKLDEVDDFAALKWARGESADRPQPDIEARDRLARELAAANASAASAERAKATIAAQLTQEASKVPDIARFADAAICEILREFAAPLVDELRSAAIALAAKIKSLEVVASMAMERAEKGRIPVFATVADHELAALGAKGLAIHTGTPRNLRRPRHTLRPSPCLNDFLCCTGRRSRTPSLAQPNPSRLCSKSTPLRRAHGERSPRICGRI